MFVVFLLVGVEITPVLVKILSPIGPYDVKLDAMNDVETTEALLKRDTTNRIIAHQYANIETAGKAETSITVQQFMSDLRTQILS